MEIKILQRKWTQQKEHFQELSDENKCSNLKFKGIYENIENYKEVNINLNSFNLEDEWNSDKNKGKWIKHWQSE